MNFFGERGQLLQDLINDVGEQERMSYSYFCKASPEASAALFEAEIILFCSKD
jgi:hypothetical protein